MLVGSILLRHDRDIAGFVQAKVGCAPFSDFAALGVVRRDRLIGGVVYHHYRQGDRSVEVTAAFEHPHWTLPGTLRALFDYPFNQLGVVRITAIASRRNKRARRLLAGLGFRLEGVVRKALDGRDDAFIFGMLRDECRWLRIHHGQEVR
jgi:RimJ/RimL family protein N-acetyltransferase